MVQIDSHCGFVKVNHVLSLDMSQYRKGFTLFHPMTWGWDVSAMNPTNFREGSGLWPFVGIIALLITSRGPTHLLPDINDEVLKIFSCKVDFTTHPK